MFLAAIYSAARPLGIDRWVVARIAQAALGAVIALLIGLIATRLWGRRTGLIALGLAAVYPPLILFGGALMTEPLLIALLLGSVLALLSRRLADRRAARRAGRAHPLERGPAADPPAGRRIRHVPAGAACATRRRSWRSRP